MSKKLFLLVNTADHRRSYLNPTGAKTIGTIIAASSEEALNTYNNLAASAALIQASYVVEAAQ